MSKLVEDLIQEIKDKAKIESDNAVARYADIDPSHLNILKKRSGKPSSENYLKLAVAAGWDIQMAKQRIQAGFSSVSILIGVAVLSVVYFLGITQLSPTQHIASSKAQSNVYYVKLIIRRLYRKVYNALNRLSPTLC